MRTRACARAIAANSNSRHAHVHAAQGWGEAVSKPPLQLFYKHSGKVHSFKARVLLEAPIEVSARVQRVGCRALLSRP